MKNLESFVKKNKGKAVVESNGVIAFTGSAVRILPAGNVFLGSLRLPVKVNYRQALSWVAGDDEYAIGEEYGIYEKRAVRRTSAKKAGVPKSSVDKAEAKEA